MVDCSGFFYLNVKILKKLGDFSLSFGLTDIDQNLIRTDMLNLIDLENEKKIEFTSEEISDYVYAIIDIGRYLPDIRDVEPPIDEYAKLLELSIKLLKHQKLSLPPSTSN